MLCGGVRTFDIKSQHTLKRGKAPIEEPLGKSCHLWLAPSLWSNLDTRKTQAWKNRSHCSHGAVGCCNSSHGNYPCRLDAFKRVVESAKAKLFCCQLQSQRLELLECMHSIVRRWVNFAHAEKNEHGVLWRDLPLPFDRNESMQYGVLSLWLCLYMECVECVCSMWKFYSVPEAEYHNKTFLQRNSVPCEWNTVLQRFRVSTTYVCYRLYRG